MKKILILSLIGVALLTSCDFSAPIPIKKMSQIYYEMALMDQYMEKVPEYRIQSDSNYVYLPIIERNGYDLETFRAANDYYLRNPDKLAAMMKTVQRKLQARMGELDRKASEPEKEDDIGDDEILPVDADADEKIFDAHREGREKEDEEIEVIEEVEEKPEPTNEEVIDPRMKKDADMPRQEREREKRRREVLEREARDNGIEATDVKISDGTEVPALDTTAPPQKRNRNKKEKDINRDDFKRLEDRMK